MMQDWVKKGWVVPTSSGTNQFYAEGQLSRAGHGRPLVLRGGVGSDEGQYRRHAAAEDRRQGREPERNLDLGHFRDFGKPRDRLSKFLSFLLKDKAYREYAKTQSAYPGLKSFAAESPLYAEGGPLAIAFEQASKTAIARPPHPAYPTITSAFMQAVDKIFNGGDAQEALTAAAKKIDEDIEDNA